MSDVDFYELINPNIFDNAQGLAVRFDTISDNQYINALSSVCQEDDILHQVDHRNQIRCKMCDLHQIPTVALSTMSIIHLNIRSVPGHYEELEALSDSLNHPQVIGLSETWLSKHNEALYSRPGYHIFAKSRPQRSGGGVALLIRDNIQCSLRSDLDTMLEGFAESVFVEIRCHNLNTSVIIAEVYRPPQGNINEFIHNFSNLLACLAESNTKAYIMGDYNLDLAKYPQHQPTVDLITTLISFSFMPLVNRTTQATQSSLNVIDNIFSNDMSSALVSET